MSERVWLRHPTTGGVFHCPAEAADEWRKTGWQPCEAPPPSPSPVVAELLLHRSGQTKVSRRAATDKKE